MYTIVGEAGRTRKEAVAGSSALIVCDPFNAGVEAYSVRYMKGKRKGGDALGERGCGMFLAVFLVFLCV